MRLWFIAVAVVVAIPSFAESLDISELMNNASGLTQPNQTQIDPAAKQRLLDREVSKCVNRRLERDKGLDSSSDSSKSSPSNSTTHN